MSSVKHQDHIVHLSTSLDNGEKVLEGNTAVAQFNKSYKRAIEH